MRDYIDYVKDSVVSNSYSSSKGYIGFCYSDDVYAEVGYLKLLMMFIDEIMGDFYVISSLNINYDLNEHKEDYELSIEEERRRDFLIQSGVIVNIERSPKDNFFHFCRCVDKEVAINILYFIICSGGATGHVFFVDKSREFIIYPHDDGGIGFIFTSDNEKKHLKFELLNEFSVKYKDIVSFDFS